MDEIKIGSVITPNLMDKAYVLLNSIKQNKKPDTKIEYWLFIAFSNGVNIPFCQEYYKNLISDDFQIHFLGTEQYRNRINPHGASYVLFVRCFFPEYFSSLDKILHFDIDMVCLKEGIEELWNMPLDGLYVRAVIDPPVNFSTKYHYDYDNVRSNNYFNAGMMLMNLAEIRKDGKDKELIKWSLNWEHDKLVCNWRDQTLLNYMFKDKAKLIPLKWNNQMLGAFGCTKEAFAHCLKLEGYDTPLDSINDTVLLHFCGFNKPYNPNALATGLSAYPYMEEAKMLWDKLNDKYGRKV